MESISMAWRYLEPTIYLGSDNYGSEACVLGAPGVLSMIS